MKLSPRNLPFIHNSEDENCPKILSFAMLVVCFIGLAFVIGGINNLTTTKACIPLYNKCIDRYIQGIMATTIGLIVIILAALAFYLLSVSPTSQYSAYRCSNTTNNV